MRDNDETQGSIYETDVEGHRQLVKDAEPDGMHQTGPTTQGEIFRRWPSDNPHGDS